MNTDTTTVREPRVTYLRDKKGFPVVCLAYSRLAPGVLHFGLACHNPYDKFNKHLAHSIAVGRCLKSPNTFYFDVENAPLKNVLHDLMLKIVKGDWNFPMRVRKAASQYLDYAKREDEP